MHQFEFSGTWGERLSQTAPELGRPRKNLVRENEEVVQDGGFKLESGERVEVPAPPPTQRFVPPPNPSTTADEPPLFQKTLVTVALIDTLSASLALGDDAASLNFANAYSHGGGYKHGARAQEEDLCRLLPQLIHSLEYVPYPIKELEGECLVTRDLVAVREVGSYTLRPSQGLVNILTSAMPCGDFAPGTDLWNDTVTLRIRGVLHAARTCQFHKLVLGAWGCGAFGNPPDLVAKLFREQLQSQEFRGAFSEIVFAIIDPRGDGNFNPFAREIREISEIAGSLIQQDPSVSSRPPVDGRGSCHTCSQSRVLGRMLDTEEGQCFRCHACIDKYGTGPKVDEDACLSDGDGLSEGMDTSPKE